MKQSRRTLILISLVPLLLVAGIAFLLAPDAEFSDSRMASLGAVMMFTDIDNPSFVSPDDAEWLDPEALVMGIEMDGEAKAYPIRLVSFHHIVNDTVGEQPVVVTYCSLCSSGAIFDPTVNGETVLFDLFGLYQTVATMRDQETGSLWSTFEGRALEGELAGASLEMLPAWTMEWSAWVDEYPDTLVMDIQDEFADEYEDYPIGAERGGENSRFAQIVGSFPADDRLPESELVLGVQAGDDYRAYVLDDFSGRGVLQDEIGETPALVIYDREQDLATTYEPVVDGEMLTFEFDDEGNLRDTETGTLWSVRGEAIEGELAGAELPWLTSFVTEWYGWAAYHPQTDIYQVQ